MSNTKKIIVAMVVALVVFLLGLMLGRQHSTVKPNAPIVKSEPAKEKVYTCSMHPQIRSPNPGDCPLCAMPLVVVADQDGSSDGAYTLKLSDYAVKMASIETTEVVYQKIQSEIKTYGDIHFDEQSLATVTTRVDGYAEKLFVNLSGVKVKAGEPMLQIYSPDLLVAQHELLVAMKSGAESSFVESAKLKLLRLGFSEKQLGELVSHKKQIDFVTIYAPTTGTIIEKNIVENSAFKKGDNLYRIANLDVVWVHLNVYERDLALIQKDQKVQFTVEAYPNEVFTGSVAYAEPEIDPSTRTLHVLARIENHEHKLKAGMYVSATIAVDEHSVIQKTISNEQKEYACPMHPEIQSDEPSRCSICKMNLEKVAGQENPQVSSDDLVGLSLVIPMSSVLDSGLRKIVYVDKGENIFESREVVLGRRSGHYFPVLSGLKQGERVVVKGGFLIDSQFQIMGSPSLFYPGGLYADSSESGESKHNGSIKKDRISEELNEDISEEDSAPCH